VSGLAEAARFNNRVEADLARLYLENEGIPAILFDGEINNFYGGLFIPVRLMVPDDDLDSARALLAEEGLV
jgi:hypothetical protein